MRSVVSSLRDEDNSSLLPPRRIDAQGAAGVKEFQKYGANRRDRMNSDKAINTIGTRRALNLDFTESTFKL